MKGFDLSKLRINPSNPFPFSGSDTEWNDFKKKLDRDPEFLEANKIAYDSSRDNLVIAGNKRVQALRELGWKSIPSKYVIDCKDWSEEKRERYIYASNWNIGQWSVEFTDEEQAEEWGITFEEEEEIHLEAKEDDYVPPAEIQTDIVKGDLFELRKGDLYHRILCGDSADSDQVAKLMNGEKADMVFTDPPYGMGLDTDYSGMNNNSKFTKEKGIKSGKKYDKVIGDNDDFKPELINTIFAFFNDCKEVFIWGADYFAELLPNKNNGSWIVWDKRIDENFDKMYGSAFELCWSKNKHKREISRIRWASAFGTEREFDHKRHHPTQKPSLLAQWFFNKWGNKKDLIVDLFLGSHSTMVAAHQLERNCYGMELDEKYCQVGIDRMLKLDEDIQLFRNGKDVTKEYRKRLLSSEKQA